MDDTERHALVFYSYMYRANCAWHHVNDSSSADKYLIYWRQQCHKRQSPQCDKRKQIQIRKRRLICFEMVKRLIFMTRDLVCSLSHNILSFVVHISQLSYGLSWIIPHPHFHFHFSPFLPSQHCLLLWFKIIPRTATWHACAQRRETGQRAVGQSSQLAN